MKKTMLVVLSMLLCFSLISCAAPNKAGGTLPTIDELVIGENTDITADIKFVTFRTDIMDKLNNYASSFVKSTPM